MREKFKKKPLVAVLLPMTLLLGVVILIATSIGPLLNAALNVPLVQVENEEGNQTENLKTKKESEKIQLIAKEDGIVELKYDDNFSVIPLNEKKDELSLPIYHKETLASEKIDDVFKKIANEEKDFKAGEENELEKKVTCIQVKESETKGSFYFEFEKDQKQWIKLQRKTSAAFDVNLSSTQDGERNQLLVQFESLDQTLKESNSSDETAENVSSQKQEKNKKQDAKKQQSKPKQEMDSKSSSTEQSIEKATKDSKQEEKTDDSKPNEEEKTAEKAGSKDGQNGIEDKKDEVKPQTDKVEVEKSERVVSVPTKETKQSLKELESEKYNQSDSLRKPKLLTNAKVEPLAEKSSDGTIGIRDAKITVKTGTGSADEWDDDNNRGHDENEGNNIVRSFDHVIYLVSFSVQNESKETKYSNIRYQVITKMPNAIKLVDGALANNGEIANGENYDIANGEQYSEGIMESVISNTGQVFVPVTLSVFGADHLTELLPEFKLKIIDAKNNDTGETETINETYDSVKLKNLHVPKTFVSSKPSVTVELVQGETEKNTVFTGSTNTNESAYDVGAVTALKELDGRKKGDYRGSSFPKGKITYTLEQAGTYTNRGGATRNLTASNFAPFYVESYAPAVVDRTSETWKTTVGGRTADVTTFSSRLSAPYSKTKQIYNSEPTVADKSKIGVFDSGDFKITKNKTVTNEKYAATYNPYTYLMTGKRSPDATAKSFSSLEMVLSWDKRLTYNAATANGWSRYDINLRVNSVNYDGYTTTNNTEVNYSHIMHSPGGYSSYPVVVRPTNGAGETNYNKSDQNMSSTTPGYVGPLNTGNAQIYQGEQLYFGQCMGFVSANSNATESIFMWDPTGFKYDSSREPYLSVLEDIYTHSSDSTFKFGVAKNINTTAPYSLKMSLVSTERSKYNWYDTVEQAEAAGDISAVFIRVDYVRKETSMEVGVAPFLPITVLNSSGSTNPSGKPKVFLANSRLLEDNKVVVDHLEQREERDNVDANGIATYKPTFFGATGNVLSYNGMTYYNNVGESMFVKPFNITTKTKLTKSLYQTGEEIEVKANGTMNGSQYSKYDAALNTTLPKGISYQLNSATDGKGNIINPEVQPNPDGTTTLRWSFGQPLEIGDGVEVNFKADINSSELTFSNTGYTNDLRINTIGEMWVTNDTSNNDKSEEERRSSFDRFIVQKKQQVILNKSSDKPMIEVGDYDPRPSGGEDTSITYDVSLQNDSLDDIVDGRLLDALPFNGDKRGTSINGDYTIMDIKVSGPNSTIFYSNNSVDPQATDPNDISGWATYTPGVTPISTVKNAKSILVSAPRIKVDEELKLKVTIQPKGQKAGDVYVNDASMNSDLKLPVISQAVWTRVYGRDLTGYVWYDDDYDGLMDRNPDGTLKDPAKNIPVKLYRTSQKDGSYKKQLVKESLTKQPFIDGSGDSLIKTDATGKYKFENLPEGEYLAEFMVGDLVVQKIVIVTKDHIGSDPKLNSKADQTTYKTPEYNHPELKDLPTLLTGTDKVHHVTDVNAGLTPLSKIRLFKYEEGTVIDANGDGKLSDAEIEASGRPLKGAEFDLYEGNSTNAKDKIGSGKTGATGWLDTDFAGLPPGDYTIVETKAPEGFELLKDPIKVTVPTYNYIATVHVADKGHTKLPFTGGTKAMRIILIVSASLLVIGMTGVFLHFRPIKGKGGK